MKAEFRRIYERLCMPMTFEELRELNKEFRVIGDYTDDLLAAMHEQLAAQHWGCLCRLIWAIPEPTSQKFTSILCDLLDNHRETEILEAVADAMFSLRDNRAVRSLVGALGVEVVGDADHHFNRKLIYALANTGTPEAIEGIKVALQSPDELIRSEAQRELRRISSK